MKRKIVTLVVLMLGMLTAGSTAVASAEPPGMTHNSICEVADCMTHD